MEYEAGWLDDFPAAAKAIGLQYEVRINQYFHSWDMLEKFLQEDNLDKDRWTALYMYDDDPHVIIYFENERAALMCALLHGG